MNRSLTLAMLIIIGPFATAQELRPRAELRGKTVGDAFSGRLLGIDSLEVHIELPGGVRRSILRRDIASIEYQHSGARKGKWILGVTGAVAGALFYGGLSQAYCTPEQKCERHLPAAVAGGGLVGGAVGALAGSALGSMFVSWRPAPNPRIAAAKPRSCIQRPRLEGQLGRRAPGDGANGLFSVGFGCSRRFTGGAEVGVLEQGEMQAAEGGVFTRGDFHTRFVGAFGEAVLVRRVVVLSAVASVGSYRIHETSARVSGGVLIDEFSRQDHRPGGAAGLKVTRPLGTRLAIGVTSRAHWFDGTRRITSGLLVAVSP